MAAGLLAVALMAAGRGGVAAHSFLVRTEPVDGASLAASPTSARIVFSDPVLVSLTSVDLVDQAGRTVGVTLEGTEPSAELMVRIPRLTAGVYRLSWATVSSGDLHRITGSIVFGVDRAADPANASLSRGSPSFIEAALRALNVLAFTIITGSLTVAVLLGRGARRFAGRGDRSAQRLARRLLSVSILGGLVALVAAPALLIAQASETLTSAEAPLQALSTIAGPVALRTVALCGLLALVVGWRRRNQSFGAPDPAAPSLSRKAAAATALSLGLVALFDTWTSHAAAGDAGWAGVLTGASHLTAAAVWAGGLGMLAVVVLPSAWRSVGGRRLAFATLREFSWVAAAAVLVAVVSGLALAARMVSSLDALLVTLYGQLLLAKFQFVGIAALVGLANAAALHRGVRALVAGIAPPLWRPRWITRWRPRWMTRLVPVEAGAVMLVVALGAVIAATPPANGPQFRPQSADDLPPSYAAVADDLLVRVAIRPGRPGANFVSLGVFETRRPALGRIEQVTVRLVRSDGSAPVVGSAQSLGDGNYEIAAVELPSAGIWRLEVVVRRDGLPPVSVRTDWVVKPPIPTIPRHPTVLSDVPLASILNTVAVIVAAAGTSILAMIALSRRLRGRRRSGRDSTPAPPFLRPAIEEASR